MQNLNTQIIFVSAEKLSTAINQHRVVDYGKSNKSGTEFFLEIIP